MSSCVPPRGVMLGLAKHRCREELRSTCFSVPQTHAYTGAFQTKGRKSARWCRRCGCRSVWDRCWCEGTICYLTAWQMRSLAAVLLHLTCASRWPDSIARHRCQLLSFPGGQGWSKGTVWSTALVSHCMSLKALRFYVRWILLLLHMF